LKELRVFVIDDSAVIRSVIGHLLDAVDGVRVIGTATSVTEARAGIAASQPDVVTLDLEMPEGDGSCLLAEYKGTAHPALVVVSASTRHDSAASAQIIAQGADACFDKTRIMAETDLFVRTLRLAAYRRWRLNGGASPDRATV
jgi:two-component system chemotaxis response regulator CheB